LPGETFFSAALEHMPELLDEGVQRKVILATPLTLIALLKAVAYGWQQQSVTENAKKISSLGKELYKRLNDMGQHFSHTGKHLQQAVEAYNRTVGSLETRVLVSARKLSELQGDTQTDTPLETPDLIEKTIRLTESATQLLNGA